jgi:hypothetical protein
VAAADAAFVTFVFAVMLSYIYGFVGGFADAANGLT